MPRYYVLLSAQYPLLARDGVKAGSQSDARPCIALIRETHKFIISKIGDFLTTRRKKRNAEQCKDRIRVYPSIMLRFYKRRREDDATQRII